MCPCMAHVKTVDEEAGGVTRVKLGCFDIFRYDIYSLLIATVHSNSNNIKLF